VTVHRAGDRDGRTAPSNTSRRSPNTPMDFGDIRETLTKVNETRNGYQEEATPKYPPEPATVVRSGEALLEPIQKERFVPI
jgi:hypothetical protein